MPSLLRKRRLRNATLLGIGVLLAGCTGSDSDALDTTTTTSESVAASAATPGIDVAFTSWYNAVTSGDATPPTCSDTAPIWVKSDSIAPSASGPLLVCADRTDADALVIRVVNNASGPLTVTYQDAAAGWSVESDDPTAVWPLPGGTGSVIRPGTEASMTAAPGTWTTQALTVDFPERWAIIEATSSVMDSLGLDDTFDWATTLGGDCDVDALVEVDRGAPLEAGLNDYFSCVFDGLDDAVDDADRAALADVVPLVAQLVEQARNVASQQEAGTVESELSIVAELPEPAGPEIEDTAPATVVTQPPTSRRPTTQAPTTQAPTTQRPTTTVAPTTAPTTAPAPSKVPTTEADTDLTVPLPPAPVLVALETVAGGVETYTSWPAIDPKLGRIPGGQIVVVECKAFTDATIAGGNGWWYRIGSGAASGGWASAVGFDNLVSGVAKGATTADNVNETVVAC